MAIVLPMEAFGDVLRPSMLGPSSGSAEVIRETGWTICEIKQLGFDCGSHATSAWSSWLHHFRCNLRLRQENKQPVTLEGVFPFQDAVTFCDHWTTLTDTCTISYFVSCQKEVREAERHHVRGSGIEQWFSTGGVSRKNHCFSDQ